MPTNVLAVGLFAVTAAFIPTGMWFLKLKPFNGEKKIASDRAFASTVGAVGIYAFMAGFYLMAASPLRDPYNEFSVDKEFLNIKFEHELAVHITTQRPIFPASYLAFLGGIINILYVYINETLIHNSNYPIVFVAAALVGLSAPAATHIKSVWASRVVGILCIVLALVTLYIGLNALTGHIARGLKPA